MLLLFVFSFTIDVKVDDTNNYIIVCEQCVWYMRVMYMYLYISMYVYKYIS